MFYMKSKVPPEIQEKILDLKSQYYSKGSLIRAITKQSGSKQQAEEYYAEVTGEVYAEELLNPELVKEKALSEIKSGAVLFAVSIPLAFIFRHTIALTIGGLVWIGVGAYNYSRYKSLIRNS